MMKFEYKRIDTLPRLSWCARIDKGNTNIVVFHGSWVEVSDDFFCSGVWSGSFESADFDTNMLVGSGGKIINNNFLVASPNHTLDRIWVKKNEKRLLVSNSLPFVLSQADDDLDQSSLLYDTKLASCKFGLKKYIRSIPTQSGAMINLFYHCNLLINAELFVAEKPKTPVRDFGDYSDYVRYLKDTIKKISRNANSEKRQIKYEPLATISSGYDSPTAAVLSLEAGCKEALTFAKARGQIDVSDSGEKIAGILGLKVNKFDRLDYLNQNSFPEVDTYGGPCEFASFSEKLKQRILFTGFNGDKIWDKNNHKVNADIIRCDPSGHSLAELALHHGWINLPVPFLGCTSYPSIHRISNSKEMMPWSTGNNYDRPISRRLVEEAGVDRNLFGQKKRAVGVYVTSEGLKPTMTQESYNDFTSFCEKNWSIGMYIRSLLLKSARYLINKNTWFNNAISYVLKKTVGLKVHLPLLIPEKIDIYTYGYIGPESLLFQWSIKKLIKRYKFY
jgi:hypothetical protein